MRCIHGMRETPTYSSWVSMKSRCLNRNDSSFNRYGGRGITVCDRWLDFRAFFEDMGPRPHGMSLDRIDGTRGYSPDNCRWATQAEQNANRRMPRGDQNGSRLHPERLARGCQNGNAKLTAEQVAKIRILGARDVPQQVIAHQFGVSQPTIGAILRGKTWAIAAQ